MIATTIISSISVNPPLRSRLNERVTFGICSTRTLLNICTHYIFYRWAGPNAQNEVTKPGPGHQHQKKPRHGRGFCEADASNFLNGKPTVRAWRQASCSNTPTAPNQRSSSGSTSAADQQSVR